MSSSARSASMTKRGRSTSYQWRRQPAANGERWSAADTARSRSSQCSSSGSGLGRAPYARWPRSGANRTTGRSSTSTASHGSRAASEGAQSQSSASVSSQPARERAGEGLVRQRQVAGQRRRGRSSRGRVAMGVGLGASQPGLGFAGLLQDSRRDVRAGGRERPGEVGDGARQQLVTSADQDDVPARSGRDTRPHRGVRRRLGRERAEPRVVRQVGRPRPDRADDHVEQGVRLRADRGQAVLDPVAVLGHDDHRDHADLASAEPESAAEDSEQPRPDRPGNPPQRRPRDIAQARPGRRARHG